MITHQRRDRNLDTRVAPRKSGLFVFVGIAEGGVERRCCSTKGKGARDGIVIFCGFVHYKNDTLRPRVCPQLDGRWNGGPRNTRCPDGLHSPSLLFVVDNANKSNLISMCSNVVGCPSYDGP